MVAAGPRQQKEAGWILVLEESWMAELSGAAWWTECSGGPLQ